MEITTIGLDIAKRVFQVHGADRAGQAVLRRKLQRGDVLAFFAKLPGLPGRPRSGATAHHWARATPALGHTVRLLPSGLRQALRQTRQDRRGRCRGDLRGGVPSEACAMCR